MKKGLKIDLKKSFKPECKPATLINYRLKTTLKYIGFRVQ